MKRSLILVVLTVAVVLGCSRKPNGEEVNMLILPDSKCSQQGDMCALSAIDPNGVIGSVGDRSLLHILDPHSCHMSPIQGLTVESPVGICAVGEKRFCIVDWRGEAVLADVRPATEQSALIRFDLPWKPADVSGYLPANLAVVWAAGQGSSFAILDAHQGQPTIRFYTSPLPIQAMCFISDTVVAIMTLNEVALFEWNSSRVLKKHRLGDDCPFAKICYIPHRNAVACSELEGRTLRLLSLSSGTTQDCKCSGLISAYSYAEAVNCVIVASSRDSSGFRSLVDIIDLETYQCKATYKLPQDSNIFSVSTSESLVTATQLSSPRRLSVYNLRDLVR